MVCREGEGENLKEEIPDNKKRDYQYKFFEVLGSKYVKLMFYIEYSLVQHRDEKKMDVIFDLDLLYFGNPCDKLNCSDPKECWKDPKETLQIEGACYCPYGREGDDCTIIDYCASNVSLTFFKSDKK
jgi:hypothetical protein